MGKLIGALILVATILIGFVLPKSYNDDFSAKYRQGIINMGLSFLCAMAIVFFWSATDFKESVWYVVSVVLLIGSIVYTGITIFRKSKRLTGSTSCALVSVLVQFLSVAGVLMVILFVIAMLIGGDGKKKKKR